MTTHPMNNRGFWGPKDLDPIPFEEKKQMTRFMPVAFLPDYKEEYITQYNQDTGSELKLNRALLELFGTSYFEKTRSDILGSFAYTFVKSCPPFPTSLEVPVSLDFFKRKEHHRDLTLQELSECMHFLTHIHNRYLLGYENNDPVIYALEKSILLSNFLNTSIVGLDLERSEKINELLEELKQELNFLTLPHFYTHPSDPYSFYVHQLAGLIFYELRKYQK